jgi:ankyrin repeat protein
MEDNFTLLSEKIGLTAMHWAVINSDHVLLETLLEQNPKAGDKTIDMLFCKPEIRDNRIFVAGDFFFPPDRVQFPLSVSFDKGTYPIHIAAAIGNTKAIEIFTKFKVNLNVKDNIGATPLHLASFYGQFDAVKLLINKKTKIDDATKVRKSLVFYDVGTTALHAAINGGHLQIATWLIENGADVSLQTKFGCDSYFFAARSGKPEIIKLLSDAQLPFPKLAKYGNFPLLEAVKTNSFATVEALLKLGSPVMEPQGHQAPMHCAVENNYLNIRQLLIEYGAKPFDYGNIVSAARSNDTTYIQNYFQEKKDLNIKVDGATALMMASAHGRIEAVKLLLDLGADPNIATTGTALHWALANSYYNIAFLILEYKPDCTMLDEHGNSILFKAIWHKNDQRLNMCQQMIALGANPHSKSRHGINAYEIAKREDDQELLALFDQVSAQNAIDASYVSATTSKVLENLPHKYNWKTVYNDLWEELVPPRGEAPTIQGELLRSVGKLSDEYYRNGNMNWDNDKTFYLDMVAFLKKILNDKTVATPEKELNAYLLSFTYFKTLNYQTNKQDDPHSKITEAVVAWCAAHKTLIPLT